MLVRRSCFAFMLLFAISHAAAQAGTAPAAEGTLPALPPPPPPPPPPPAGEAGPPSDAAPAQPATPVPATTEAACVPSCRSGYLCHAGQCVSACNPPCQPGEQCAANGECAMDLGGVSYPAPRASGGMPSIYQGVAAVPPPPDPGKERHDGLMLRLTLGFGSGIATLAGDASQSTAAYREKLSGASLGFSFDIGGSPIDNLVIHARLADMGIIDPSVRLNGTDQGTLDHTSLIAVLYGVAVSYYFMPINLYLTGALGTARIGASPSSGDTAWGKFGFGMNIDVGKEWWVGDNWGLGVAGRFWYAHTGDDFEGLPLSYDFVAWTLMFSATYQ